MQISALLMVASLVLVSVLPSSQKTLDANRITADRMNELMKYFRIYMSANGSLPCPGDATLATGAANYGVTAAGSGSSSDCTGSTPAANYVDASNNVAIGMVPYKALGIPRELIYDGWGRVITYAVDTSITGGGCWSSPATGSITVTDNGTALTTVIALISHGANGHGAWIPLAASSGTGVRLNNNSSNSNELTNAHVNASFAATSTLNNFVITTPSSTFDDLIVYKSPLWTMNARPTASSGSGGSSITNVSTPATGFYTPTETLYTGLPDTTTITFTVTLDSAVTVSGTPRLTLTAPSVGGGTVSLTGNSGSGGTGYANYSSGSGSTSLVFTYPVQSTDLAPNGLTMATSIALNGGTITSLCSNSFTAPTLTGVVVPKAQAITASGTWTVPVDWNNTYNAVMGIGSGGNGATGTATAGGAGGGGGAAGLSTGYSTSGGGVSVVVGSGGGTTKTMFGSTAFLDVDYGKNASGTTAGAGGTTAATTVTGTGSLEYTGGTGGNNGGTTRGGGGGGGAALIGTSAGSPGAVGRNGGNGANTGGGGGGGGGSWPAAVLTAAMAQQAAAMVAMAAGGGMERVPVTGVQQAAAMQPMGQ